MKEVTLNVCQGVGDIFWVYQKFAPHVDVINFNIACLPDLDRDDNKTVSLRATSFLKLLPQVEAVDFIIIPSEQYDRLANGYHSMIPLMAAMKEGSPGPFNYACNRPLEDGIRIEDIDPFEMQETVPMRTEACPLAYPEKQ